MGNGGSSQGSFVHLHNHTEYSMLDGAAKIKPMLVEAQRLEMPAVGMTDHGNMFGASEFYTDGDRDRRSSPSSGSRPTSRPGSRFDNQAVLPGAIRESEGRRRLGAAAPTCT